MRLGTSMPLATLLLLTCAGAARAQEQQKDEQVIEEFVTTRGVSFEEPGKRPQKKAATPAPPRRNNSAAGKSPAAGGVASGKGPGGKAPSTGKSNAGGTSRPGGGGTEVAAQSGGESAEDGGVQTLKASAAGGARPLAVGYTILMKDEAGRLSVVDASREFRTGDNIAIALETNADGYLYMFNASDGRNPEMLFPNVQLDGGANSLQAHARATFPADPSLDFRFTDPPAREHLFIVFSREPLAGVPTGDALVKFCGNNQDDCSWKPPASLWERIRRGAKGQGIVEAKNTQLAQAGPTVMPGTLQRGIKVKKNDPKPAVVRVNNSPDADLLVTEIVLTHK